MEDKLVIDTLVEGIKKGTIKIEDIISQELKAQVKALLEVTT
jgi:hypothetical protein